MGFTNKPNIHVMMDFKWWANLELCYLLFLSILWCQQTRSQFHKDIVSRIELDETDFLFNSNSTHTWCEHFKLFSTSAASRPNIFSINGMIVMISGIAFDRPDSLSHLRAFPDHFKIYTMLPIVRIELNSIHAIDRGHLSHPGHLRSSG